MDAVFLPQGQNKFYLVYGTIYIDGFIENTEIELRINECYDTVALAKKCLSTLRKTFPSGSSDIGIQEHIVNKVAV